MRVLLLLAACMIVPLAGSVGPASASSQGMDRSVFYGCGKVKVPVEEGGTTRMQVLKVGSVTCSKAKKVWKRFMAWYARNTAGGTVKIMGFRCKTGSAVYNTGCKKGRSEVRGS